MESGQRLEIVLASGAVFPDWSVVSSEKVEKALADFLDAFGAERAWSGLTGDEDRVRRATLAEFAATGHAPTLGRLSKITGLPADDISAHLKSLAGRDLVVLAGDGDRISGAYPFTDRETGHQVHLGNMKLNAMCAIDALGAGAMCNMDTVIRSACRRCGLPVLLETRDKGTNIASVSPETAVVWSGIQSTDGCSADTMCQVMAFFCSDECLTRWRTADASGATGHRLTIEQGIQAGKAIFAPMLVSP